MRSPVGWLCFGIFVVCVISVKSGVSAGNYQIIHGHGFGYPGAIFQRVSPKTGYRSVVPISVGRRIVARSHIDDEEDSEPIEDEREEEEEDVVHGPSHPHQQMYDEEEDREEEEEEEEDEGLDNIGVGIKQHSDEDEDDEFEERYLKGYLERQAYRNNIRKPSPKLRTSLQKSSSKEGQLSPIKSSKKTKKSKKTTTFQISEEISPIKAKSKNSNITSEINENHKQKYQLKANSHAHQFVTTPIADLILKLSISLARPIGHANGTATYFNVPIRLFSTGTELKNISALNASMGKVETELHKTNSSVTSPSSFKVVSVPIKTEVLDNQEIDDKEDDEDEDTEQV